MIPEEQVEELLIGVKTPIHLSEAGEEIVEDVVEEKKVVQTRRCQPLLPLGTSTFTKDIGWEIQYQKQNNS